MKIIYIDSNFHCHVTNDGTMQAVETDFFNAKCDEFIEGYRYIPEGRSWTREDGEVFTGVMIAPYKPWDDLNYAQDEYAKSQYPVLLAENESLLEALAAVVDDVYSQDIGEMEE